MVLAAVDLYELAGAIAAVTRLLDAFATLRPGFPNAIFDHPFAKRLRRDSDVVVLLQLLRGEPRAEVCVVRAHKSQSVLLVRLGDPIGCRPASAFVS